MSEGYVYVLSNPAMPGLLKVGKTTRNPETRAEELFTTGVPRQFVIEACEFTPDCHLLEEMMHEDLSEFRVIEAREFFEVSLDIALDTLWSGSKFLLEDFVRKYSQVLTLVDREAAEVSSIISTRARPMGCSGIAFAAAVTYVPDDQVWPLMDVMHREIVANRAKEEERELAARLEVVK